MLAAFAPSYSASSTGIAPPNCRDQPPSRRHIGYRIGWRSRRGQRRASRRPCGPQRTIRRHAEKHSWLLVGGSPHESTLPWSDEAPAINVVLWLKTQMGGRVNVTVEL